jgi:hypothetical protein
MVGTHEVDSKVTRPLPIYCHERINTVPKYYLRMKSIFLKLELQ